MGDGEDNFRVCIERTETEQVRSKKDEGLRAAVLRVCVCVYVLGGGICVQNFHAIVVKGQEVGAASDFERVTLCCCLGQSNSFLHCITFGMLYKTKRGRASLVKLTHGHLECALHVVTCRH